MLQQGMLGTRGEPRELQYRPLRILHPRHALEMKYLSACLAKMMLHLMPIACQDWPIAVGEGNQNEKTHPSGEAFWRMDDRHRLFGIVLTDIIRQRGCEHAQLQQKSVR